MSITVDIPAVAYDQGNQAWLPGLKPYPYQWQALQLVQQAFESRETLCLFLVTPTGSGKTLTSYAYSLQTGQSVLGVYPTNELIRDQEKSLSPLYRKFLGWDEWVYRIDSKELDKWALEFEERRHSDMLERMLNWKCVLLTNPDILYYIAFGQYAKGNESQRRRLLATLGDNYKLMVFDEFHLYNVKQTADVVFFVSALQAINPSAGRVFIFASATPESPAIDWLKKLNIRVEKLQASPSNAPDARIIAQLLRLTLLPADLGRWKGQETIVENLPLIDQFIEQYPEARIVSILDSVAGSINLAQELRSRYSAKQVGEVHGLSSDEERKQALEAAITVGTSTIEVGIDFKEATAKDVLIFEAHTDSKFLQRFGRLARHKKTEDIPNWALALVPEYVYHFLAGRMNLEEPLTREMLYELIREAYNSPEEFSAYLRKHAAVEFVEARNLIRSLFQQDVRPAIVNGVDDAIYRLTGKNSKQAEGAYRGYKERGILAPLLTFRGADFQAAILDNRGTDLGFPAKRYSLMFLLRRGSFEELSEKEYLSRLEQFTDKWPEVANREMRFSSPIGKTPDDLLGVYGYFKLNGLLEQGRKVWFELDIDDVSGRKGEICVVRGLQVCTDPPMRLRLLNKLLRKKAIVAWFMDKPPAQIQIGRSLPNLFAIYELHVDMGGGMPDRNWTIAFNQNAFFLDSLNWYRDRHEEMPFFA